VSARLTVIIEDSGALLHIGGAMGYRRVTLDLTAAQEAALALRHEGENYGTTFLEPAAPATADAKEMP
jgi:hypothetical protein